MMQGPQDPVTKARIALLFELAWLQPGKFRAQFLQGIASGEPAVLAEVQRLLAAAEADNLGNTRNEARAWLDKRLMQPSVQEVPSKPAAEPQARVGQPTGASEPSASTSLSDFEILRPLDDGGLGVAQLARQKSLGRLVVLKTYKSGGKETESSRKQFLRAAQQAARLQHPHIVTTYTAGIEGDTLYYVMEYVEGVTLQRVIEAFALYLQFADDRAIVQLPLEVRVAMRLDFGLEKQGESSTEVRARVRHHALRRPLTYMIEAFLPVLEAIEYAHRQGIVHGDIKPSNLLFDHSGRLLVLDFGLATSITMAQAEGDDLAPGTARYFSPEQVANARLGTSMSTDIYTLGATLYEMVALRPAYEGASSQVIRAKIATENPPRLREHNSRVHGDLESIVERAMHRQPRRRYASVGAMASDLKRFLQRQPLASGNKRVTRLVRRIIHDHPFLALACSMGLMALLVFGAKSGLEMLSTSRQVAKVEVALADLERSVAAAADVASGEVDSVKISALETHLDAALADLRRAGSHGVGDDLVAEKARWFHKERLEVRVKAYCAAAEREALDQYLLEACQHIEEAKKAGVDISAAAALLREKKAVAELSVSCRKSGQITCSIRRIDRRTKAVLPEALDSQPLPATFQGLGPGGYVVRVSEPGKQDISFPVIVEKGMRYAVTLPVRPADVPTDMVYVPCADHEVIMYGDHDTQVSANTYGTLPKVIPRSFYIDRCEVTNAKFLEFLQATEHKELLEEAYEFVHGKDEEEEYSEEVLASICTSRPLGWLLGKPQEGTERLPVRLREVHHAVAFAKWSRGSSLPTREEWERAARGLDSRVYPYGDEFKLEAHWSLELTEVGSHPEDVTVYGAMDMLGSVKELVLPNRGTNEFGLRGREHNDSDPFQCRLSLPNGYYSEGRRQPRRSQVARSQYQDEINGELALGFRHRDMDGYGFRTTANAESPVWHMEPLQ